MPLHVGCGTEWRRSTVDTLALCNREVSGVERPRSAYSSWARRLRWSWSWMGVWLWAGGAAIRGLGVGFERRKSRPAIALASALCSKLEDRQATHAKVKLRRARVRYGRIDAYTVVFRYGLKMPDCSVAILLSPQSTCWLLLCHRRPAPATINPLQALPSPILSQTHCTDCKSGSGHTDWLACQAQSRSALLTTANEEPRVSMP